MTADARKIVFLDIDGPMIPHRAYLLAKNHGRMVTHFDPVAVAFVQHLLVKGPAQLVVSSAWAHSEHSLWGIISLLGANGIDSRYIHWDWRTPREHDKVGSIIIGRTRADEILAWLAKHPEVTHWVALDDEPVPAPGGVQCSFNDGLLIEHFKAAGAILGIDERVLFVERLDAPHDAESRETDSIPAVSAED